jgi:hypothetical protein
MYHYMLHNQIIVGRPASFLHQFGHISACYMVTSSVQQGKRIIQVLLTASHKHQSFGVLVQV